MSRELKKIKKEALTIGTFMKAPNGKPTNLTKEQWLQARTKAFKENFGDWEKAYQKKVLLTSKVVSVLTGNEFKKVEGKTLTEQVAEYFDAIGGVVHSPIFGDVVLDKGGADDSFAHGVGRLKATAYASVKDVIEKGILINSDLDHKERGYNSHLIAAPITIAKDRYICLVVIKQNTKECRFYLHEVIIQKWLLNKGSNTGQNQPQCPKAFAKILQDIVSASDDVLIFVNKNGEPLAKCFSTNDDTKKLSGLSADDIELLELEAEALALILQLGENKGKEEKSSSNSTPKYKVGDVFVASDRYWKITSVLTANEDITYFVDEYRKGKNKTYHTNQQSLSESELENKMLAQGAVLQKDKENQNSYPERNGKITADVLKKTFAFRYVNVDINLDEKQEQDMLDVSYDTFRQLAMLLNIPMNAIGLGRNLTLNIGLMRMDLTTGACYSPQYRALNFKGLESFKHIAHEWFHAFDHYLNYAHDNMNAKGLFSEECYNETTHYGKTAQDNIAAVIKAIDGTPYYSRSAGVAKASRFGKYWTSNCELLARAFEVYVKNLMEKHDINNSHLVSLFPNNPYPNYSDPKDMPIQDAFKVLFDGLTMKKTIYGDEALYGN